MRYALIILSALVLFSCSDRSKWTESSESKELVQGVQDKEYEGLNPYQKRVKRYQDSMSVVFLSGQNAVIPKEELIDAKPLQYFEPSEKYRVKARFEKIENGEVFEMKTNTERTPEYKRYGILHFEIMGDSGSLALYQNVEHPDYLFCPFKDLTNGKETYGAGRYLDFSPDDLKNPVIDFNYCYNPYCAYNHDYSCPIPPVENHLNFRIEAGVKTWH
ncbi:DUF1684 domain-containing protein [bacterium]|jgi:hypothetical protein|nr:DUF1684 domain-containing protein [bacterium]